MIDFDSDKRLFIFRCAYEQRFAAKAAGFSWDDAGKIWYTQSYAVAAKLQGQVSFSSGAIRTLESKLIRILPWFDTLPPKADSLFHYQREGLLFALTRNRAYIAFRPGLGKTPIAALFLRLLKNSSQDKGHQTRLLYVTPPFLVKNIQRELARWGDLGSVVLNTENVRVPLVKAQIVKALSHSVAILPDSMLTAPWLPKFLEQNFAGSERILVVDEAHRFRSLKAKRTRALFGPGARGGIASLFQRSLFMSGSPMVNRPMELYPVLASQAPETIDFATQHDYGLRYCGAEETPFGWLYQGASNLPELIHRITDKYMLPGGKDLLDLPPRYEQIVVLSGNTTPKLEQMAFSVVGKTDQKAMNEEQIMSMLAGKAAGDVGQLATYRRLIGIHKAPQAAEYVRGILEAGEESVLVFAYHLDVINLLQKALVAYAPFVVTGKTPNSERDRYVQQFQATKSACQQLFIANYQAMGVGFTLTKATRVVFVEFSWVPADNDQAADRTHRIGQTDPVSIDYLTYDSSVDEAVIRTILRKRETTNQV